MKEDPSLMEGDERRFKLQCPYVMCIGTACFHAPRFLEGWRSRHTDHPTCKATVVTVSLWKTFAQSWLRKTPGNTCPGVKGDVCAPDLEREDSKTEKDSSSASARIWGFRGQVW